MDALVYVLNSDSIILSKHCFVFGIFLEVLLARNDT